MQKLLFLSLCGALSFFLYVLWYGHGSIYDCYRLQKMVVKEQSDNQALIDRNSIVRDRLLELKGSDELVEISSRRNLGLVKTGEILVNFPNDVDYIKESTLN